MSFLNMGRGSVLTVGFAAALALAGCGGDSSSNKTSLDYEATVAHGAVVGASCSLFDADGDLIASGFSTDENGQVDISAKVNKKKFPVTMSCTGGTYYNEATGQTETQTGALRSIVPDKDTLNSVGGEVAVTPLTDLAVELFSKASNKDPVAAKQALSEVRDALAPSLGTGGTDLLQAPQPVKNNTDTVGGGVQGEYALYLAGLAKAAQQRNVTPEQLLDTVKGQVQQGTQIDTTVADDVVAGAKTFANEQGDDDAKATVENDVAGDGTVDTPTGGTGATGASGT